MRGLVISQGIQDKLDKKTPPVTEKEVCECFDNKCGENLIDDREDNRTDPATLWFIAETNKGRLLKIVFIFQDGSFRLKTAYDPNQVEIDIYEKYGK
ncbi:ADP-ribosyl-(dinitrogen reductase) hydrolase [Herbaspirillum sp. VT-16-41]|uniref:ADP-ribosyl-(dinitrogen reductase) hydrolase n=1 Tax=Herbaspirillum sp. VT-16-41 TaxID=1953765 RepID=UPI0009812BB2|nr:ADP-ribosyl-(dinitrogen reductase) hydrolase [Herbaspirillum sp. VT-16-41]ONN66733.1 ADP-ribosyl-(dinitrogen reductase) hydrolase [Herbaspirillum sp. VT-16-41]